MNVKSTFGKFHLGTMVSHHMSQTDLNSKLIPDTTFPIVVWKKKEKEPPKKKIKKNQKKTKKIKKIKKILKGP